jgi:peptidoglycan/LPS O-acetylase OafA/YrhL
MTKDSSGKAPTPVSSCVPSSPEPSSAGEARRPFYHPELDVLRFAAFCAVFIAHALPTANQPYLEHGIPHWTAALIARCARSGIFGVPIFFLLSSYLITTLLLREHAVSGRLDLKSFYVRRTLRIWPLYFFFLAISFWVLPALGWPRFSPANKVGFSLFLGNWSMMAFGIPEGSAPILWSISVEEQFYLFWPLLLAWFGVGRLRRMALILLALATCVRIAVLPFHPSWTTLWFNTFVQLDPIAIGALLALAFQPGLPRISAGARMALLGAALLLLLTVGDHFGLTGRGMLLTYPLVAAAASLILVAVLTDSPAGWLSRGPLVYLGKISYGLYVYHGFMLNAAARIWPNSRTLKDLAAFGGTIVLATISYRFLERPFLKLKRRFEHVSSRPA